MSFGTILKELREERGVTQQELAKQIQYAQSRVSDWEKEVTEPSAQAIRQIARYFEVSSDFLLGLDDYGYIFEYEQKETKIKQKGKK